MLVSFGTMHFEGTLNKEKLGSFLHRKTNLQEEINQQKKLLRRLEKHVKKQPNQIDVLDLPQAHGFKKIFALNSMHHKLGNLVQMYAVFKVGQFKIPKIRASESLVA